MANLQQEAAGGWQAIQAAAEHHHFSVEELASLCFGGHADGAFDAGPKFKPHALGQ